MSMKAIQFPYAIKSFIGYLEGTQKSKNTIKNYRLDLQSFQDFINRTQKLKSKNLSELTSADLEAFHNYLKMNRLKTNTRRRKLLTLRRFLRYHTQRKKLPLDVGVSLLAPEKVERIPYIVSLAELIEKIRALPHETELDSRNRALLWTLAETGCLVSEVSKMKFQDWEENKVRITGKLARELSVSSELSYTISLLQEKSLKKNASIFLGFNKFGSMGAPITPRGVELLVRLYAERLGFSKMTPRTFRHSAVLYWFQSKVKKEEIKRRLGLKTEYAFRVYESLFKSNSAATSTLQTN